MRLSKGYRQCCGMSTAIKKHGAYPTIVHALLHQGFLETFLVNLKMRILTSVRIKLGRNLGKNPKKTREVPRVSPLVRAEAFCYCGQMSRVAREVVAGHPHPVTQRGIGRRNMFETTGDGDDATCDRTRLHTHTRTGRHCGSLAFMNRLEAKLGRVLRPKPEGGPEKMKNRCPPWVSLSKHGIGTL